MLLYRYRDIYESAGVPIPWKPQSLPKQIRELLSYGNAEAAALEVGWLPDFCPGPQSAVAGKSRILGLSLRGAPGLCRPGSLLDPSRVPPVAP